MRLLNRGLVLALACSVAMGVILMLAPDLFGLEAVFSDLVTRRIAAKIKPDPRIVIVAVNDKSRRSLEPLYGRWPWDREVMARVIEEARMGGAKVVAFDISFTGANLQGVEGDDRFAVALRSMPAILGVQTTLSPPAQLPSPVRPMLWTLKGDDAPQYRLYPPHPQLVPSAGIGTMRFSSSRRYLTVDPVAPGLAVPSLALATARAAQSLPAAAALEDDRFALRDISIAVDENRSFIIRWHGKKARSTELSYEVIDFDKMVMSSLARESPDEAAALGIDPEEFVRQFRGKIVLVGATAQGLLDLRPTPLSLTTAGVEIHANAIDNIINRDFVREAPLLVMIGLMLLVSAIFGGGLYLLHSQVKAFALMVVTSSAWLLLAWLALTQRYSMIAVAPAVAIVASYIVITAVRFMAEQRSGVRLRATFGRYVSPQILEHILANPDHVELGGERREMTILFSDIRGFTSISEASEPEEVVEMLNEYLTEMVEILLDHGGTLDKFIGDAVMGFWNAPTSDNDHALHAVECAVDMIEATARIRQRWENEGKAAIRIGIGINTGEAVVGNIGSKRVFGYTVIGDAVNLASRLESKNKDYGTEIIVSESTLERIGDRFLTVYLDEVKVKGKEKAVKIFEVKGRIS